MTGAHAVAALLLLTIGLVADTAEAQRGRGGGKGSGARAPQHAPGDGPDHVVVDGTRYPLTRPEILALIERGDGRKALTAYERAGADADKRGAAAEAFLAHASVTFVAVRFGMPQKAIRAGSRALELAPALPASAPIVNATAVTYALTGDAFRHAGDLPRARRVFEDGLAFARTLTARRDNWVSLLAAKVAAVALAQGDPATALGAATEAQQTAERALAALETGTADSLRQALRRRAATGLLLIGHAHLRAGKLGDADAALSRARTYARLIGLVEVEIEVVEATALLAQKKNDHAAALALFEEGLTLGRRVNRVQSLMALSQGAAQSYAATGQLDRALAAVKDAIRLIEDVRGELTDTGLRAGYLDEKQTAYQTAVQIALRLDRTAEAFGFAEASRARAFLDLLGNQATLSRGKTRALVDEEVRLQARLAEARALTRDTGEETDSGRGRVALEAAERDYRTFLDRVRKENLEQASLMSVEPVTLAEIQSLLPEGATLLEYLVGEREVTVWVVDRTRAKALRLPAERAALVAAVRAFRTAIADQAPIEQVQLRAAALYRMLVEAARTEIRGDRLLVVPHDVLHYLPFAALRSPEGRWLVEEFALSTLPSASVLKFLGGKGQGASDATLAVGNPDVGAGLNLRWAEREARLVGQGRPGTTVLVREAATETRVKQLLGGAGLVHFAMHGELNEADPLSSALLLSPAGGDDGRLEVRELFGMELNARLVVLSACETGLGRLSRGDELVGLQRAFLYAGTAAVITTLWKVDDRASFDLVRAFYGVPLTGDPAQALRQAQVAAMAAHPHPFAWAAFGLTGAPR